MDLMMGYFQGQNHPFMSKKKGHKQGVGPNQNQQQTHQKSSKQE